MYQEMMRQITNDRINDARKQAKAHRQAVQAKAIRQRHPGGPVEKATIRQGSRIASKLLAAAKLVKVRRTFSPGEVR